MTTLYEYKVVPAPTRGLRGQGVKGSDARFAHAIEDLMNQMSRDGWEYQRAETLPSEDRQGLTSSVTTFRNMLVFRRPRADDPAPFQPQLLEADPALSGPPAGQDTGTGPGSQTTKPPAPAQTGATAEGAAEADATAVEDAEEDENETRQSGGVAESLRRRAEQLMNGGAKTSG